MIRVRNDKVKLQAFKDGKLIKEVTLHNRLTDLYLDYTIYKMIGATLGDALYPECVSVSDLVYFPFSYSYLRWNATQEITDASTTMDYDVISLALANVDMEMITTQTSKIITTNYIFDLSTMEIGTQTFLDIGFGRHPDETAYLFSYISLVDGDIQRATGYSYGWTRYDEITSNEILIDTTANANYLPITTGIEDFGILTKISLCFGLNGTGGTYDYNMSDLTLTRGTAGILEVTGFDNFHIENDILYPSTSLYPSESLYPTQDASQFQSVKFTYLMSNEVDTQTTYINKTDLDVSYEDTEIKIKLKCERGNY
jgi:hypothetical protein